VLVPNVRATIVFSASLLSTAACGSDGARETTAATRMPIVGGAPSGPADDAVVMLVARASELETTLCSGIALAPELVATAAHCLSHTVPGDVRCSPSGELESPDGAGSVLAPLDPAQIEVYVGALPGASPAAVGRQIFSTGTTSLCRNDLAFLRLDRPLGAFAPLRAKGGVRVGERVSVIGYGATGDPEARGRHRIDRVRILDVGPESALDPPTTALPRTFATGLSTCGGDSGGPALSSQAALVGISSLTFGSCTASTVRNLFTSVPEFETFVFDTFRAAGASPWLEGESRSSTPSEASDDSCSLRSGRGAASRFGVFSVAACSLIVALIARRSQRRMLI
jgi:hypothetical protein